MPTDNVTANANTTTGPTLRTLADANGVEWPVSALAVPTTVSPGGNVMQLVGPAYGLPVQGSVGAYAQTDGINSGSTLVVPQKRFANVAAAATDTVLVAPTAGKRVRVLALLAVTGATATTLTLNTINTSSGVAVSPLLANGANGGAVLPFNPVGWFDTQTGDGLSATTGAGSATGVQVVYALV